MVVVLSILAYATGFLVKLVDDIHDHNIKKLRNWEFFFAALYGILIGVVVTQFDSPSLVSLWLATMLGVVIAGKIDSLSHLVGVLTAAVFLLISRVPTFDMFTLGIFVLAAVVDEKLDALGEKKKKGNLKSLLQGRLILPAAALVISLLVGQIEIFISLLLFDLGYRTGNYTAAKILLK